MKISVLFAVLLLLLSGTVFAAATAPLPSDLVIAAPGPEVPPDLAKMSGKWIGKCEWVSRGNKYEREQILAIEKVEGDKVHVVFSLAIFPGNTGKQGWTRYEGTFSTLTKKLSIVARPPQTVYVWPWTFALQADGSLLGIGAQVASDGPTFSAKMHRLP